MGSGASTSSARLMASGTSQRSPVMERLASTLVASLDELATRPARVVDGLVEVVVVVEGLLDALVLKSLRFHAAIQRVDRVLLLVERGEQRRQLFRRAARAAENPLPHGPGAEAGIGLGIGRPDDAGPVDVVGHGVHVAHCI